MENRRVLATALIYAAIASAITAVIVIAIFYESPRECTHPQRFFLDGCTYVLDPDYAPIEGWDSSVVDNIMHDDSNCRMPLHRDMRLLLPD
jgi:hypothetical protein